MTTTFDALQRILNLYRQKLRDDAYHVLQLAIDQMHSIQHSQGTHDIDAFIERGILGTPWEKRFHDARADRLERTRT